MPLRAERHLRRERSSRFTAALPTSIPGISFEGRGQVWYRPALARGAEDEQPSTDRTHPNFTQARAAALAGVDATARAITGVLLPEDCFEAEQKVAIALAVWRPTYACKDVEFRCRIRVTLPERDAIRYEPFAEARRKARLAVVLTEDASTALLHTHLSDITRARLWWLKQYLDQPGHDLSWKVFDEHIRPLIADAYRPENDIDRLARIILTSTDRIFEDPTRLKTLLQVLEKTFEIMGWSDLSADVGGLSERPG